ncbi:acyl-CoA dehydrogenase [Kitasatospora purpeofusca]|uniref:acyl-CoA dehydrogenase family protein n=1 Tax=Kitasatospora purpeofusca TaxID=67352 RepID=UPI0033D8BD3F
MSAPRTTTPGSQLIETPERLALRRAVADLGARYGSAYYLAKARAGEPADELWAEAGKAGYLGVNLPAEYGGGGGGITDLAIVLEELGTAGCPLLLLIVSPAICGTVIARYGTEEQKRQWLPGLADGSRRMAFGITEPDAGSNSHRISTVARRDGEDWLLTGRKVFVSGIDHCDAVLFVARIRGGTSRPEAGGDARTGNLKPALFVVPRDTPGFEYRPIPMELVSPERQFQVFLDDVRLPAEALVGDENAGLLQLFAGLNPERIMTAAFSLGLARQALGKAVEYARTRVVWSTPIGAHQGLAHPLAQCAVEIELARLMTQKAALLYDGGEDAAAGEAANMAKYAAGEAAARTVDQAVQTLGGNGLTQEYGLGALLAATRVGRVAPVSREMVLNYVAQHTLGLPKSY